MGIINAKTVIGMDIGKKYSWCEAISAKTGEVLKKKRGYSIETYSSWPFQLSKFPIPAD